MVFSTPIPDITLSKNYKLADTFVDRLEKRIAEIQTRLEPDQQLRVTALLPGGKEVLVEWIGYSNPNLVVLDGLDLQSHDPATLLLHQESVQLLCRVESVEPDKSPRKIGFRHGDNNP